MVLTERREGHFLGKIEIKIRCHSHLNQLVVIGSEVLPAASQFIFAERFAEHILKMRGELSTICSGLKSGKHPVTQKYHFLIRTELHFCL